MEQYSKNRITSPLGVQAIKDLIRTHGKEMRAQHKNGNTGGCRPGQGVKCTQIADTPEAQLAA